MTQKQMEISELKVSGRTDPKKLAGSIAMEINKNNRVEIVYIGAGAGNVAMKGIAIARGMTTTQGADLWSYPSFYKTKIDSANTNGEDESKIGMRLVVENKGPFCN